MFVVFEGIDGGGKTTLSNLVAKLLREAGLRVEHVREGGKFASSVTQAMRELGRDARNLALTPRAELMLYLTREVQLLEEATRPALARADIVIADRYVYTAEALAVYGRGASAAEVAPVVAAATGGLVPDLVVLVDVDPHVARGRRQVSKLITNDTKPPSRKGLAGTGLQHRLRIGYRELAAREPERWLVIDNTEADLAAMASALVDVVRGMHDGRSRGPVPSHAPPELRAHDLSSARTALLAWVDRRAVREPGLAAYFLDRVPGAEFEQRRRELADRAPSVIAAGLRGRNDDAAWQLRHQLAATAPSEVARSLDGVAGSHPDAAALLRSLIAIAPSEVGEALSARDDADAWALRDALPGDAVLVSLGGVSGERAWARRQPWLAGLDTLEDVGLASLICASVSGIGDARAWAVRKALRAVAPVAALDATFGLVDDRAWRWRKRWLDRAPKTVMKTIASIDDPRAWELREQVADICEEAIDSIFGLDGPRAWQLRARTIDTWPATVLKSLGALPASEQASTLVARALEQHPTNVAVWRHAVTRG